MIDTLALTTDGTWDLSLDENGNLATNGDSTGTPGLRMAQDVATQCLAFRGEVYYDSTQGVRYAQILGQVPNMVFASSEYQTQALLVPEVTQAIPALTFNRSARQLGGAIYVTDAQGTSGTVSL